jgi:2-phospho-L-lactate guanylyltransferase (CobY/MobA/RfbA family)
MATARPTLLVFTLGPVAECRRRRLLPRRLEADERTVHEAGLRAALAAGRDAGCRIEVSSPERLDLPADVRLSPQVGSEFGERLLSALERASGESAGPLVVVGTDVPGLSGAHVREALARLAIDPRVVVLGPSPDGGFYLLAAGRPLAGLLASVRWRRSDTLAQVLQALAAAGVPVALLERLADLDAPGDLERWLASRSAPTALIWRSVALRLGRLLAALTRPFAPPSLGLPRLAALPAAAGRAPPLPARR